MTRKCHNYKKCNHKIDTGHDLYYYCNCTKAETGKPVRVCRACSYCNTKCPVCGKEMHKHRESTLKKAYSNPATRGLLGF